MWYVRLIKNIIRSFNIKPTTDPLYVCDVYKDKGCAHVDGFLCNTETCYELRQYRNSKVFKIKHKQNDERKNIGR